MNRFNYTTEEPKPTNDDINTMHVTDLEKATTEDVPFSTLSHMAIERANEEYALKKEPLLNDDEYNFIKDLNKRSNYNILWIIKRIWPDDSSYEQIRVRLQTPDKSKQYIISLPIFKKGEKYTNLEVGKMYQLRDLGV